MTVDLTDPVFHDEDAARKSLEAVRWPNGPYCPHCGSFAATRMEGEAHRPGLMNCRDCRRHYSVTVGTVFERSHLPLHKWLLADLTNPPFEAIVRAHGGHGERVERPADLPAALARAAAAVRAGQQALVNVISR